MLTVLGPVSNLVHRQMQIHAYRFGCLVPRNFIGRFGSRIAVGMSVTGHARTDPYVPDSGIRLLPWVFDGKALLRPRMKDSGRRQPGSRDLLDSVPRHPILLAASPKRAPPQVDDMVPKCPECPRVRRHRVVRARNPSPPPPQPAPLFRDALDACGDAAFP